MWHLMSKNNGIQEHLNSTICGILCQKNNGIQEHLNSTICGILCQKMWHLISKM